MFEKFYFRACRVGAKTWLGAPRQRGPPNAGLGKKISAPIIVSPHFLLSNFKKSPAALFMNYFISRLLNNLYQRLFQNWKISAKFKLRIHKFHVTYLGSKAKVTKWQTAVRIRTAGSFCVDRHKIPTKFNRPKFILI